jgi:hypothetical protein
MQSMHLDEEQIWRALHGELGPQVEVSVREHLVECAFCSEQVAEARREETGVYTLLSQVDHPPPPVAAEVLVARARTARRGWQRWAAAVLLALGFAGAAYAAPGSPVRAWVNAALARMSAAPRRPPPSPTSRQGPGPSVAGIVVAPGRALVIAFTSRQATGDAFVSMTDSAEVTVHAPIGAATFTSEPDRLVIHNQGSSANFEIEIPTGAPLVEIRVGDERRLLKEGPRVTPQSTATGRSGYYIVPLKRSGP